VEPSPRALLPLPRRTFTALPESVHDGRTVLFRARTRDCGSCPIKPQCAPNMTFRKIPRDVHEDARDEARALIGMLEFDKSRDQRKRVEERWRRMLPRKNGS
jgi:DDE family transposase